MRLILTLLCISITLFSKDIHIATYNVENLFDGVNQGSEYKDFRLGAYGWSKKTAKLKMHNTVQAVKYIRADVIALQEVENERLLKELGKKTGFTYNAFAKAHRAPVGVGILSNYPIVFKEAIKTGVNKTRDFLHVKIKIEDFTLGVWVVHLPTMKYPLSQKKAVLKALKNAIDKSDDKEFLIVGDFNIKITRNSLLQKTFGTFGIKNNLYEPWFDISSRHRWSHSFYGKKNALDRMLLSHSLFDNNALEYRHDSFKVVKANFLKTPQGYPKRWLSKNKTHLQYGYSDHFPLLLTLTTSKNKPLSSVATLDELFTMPLGKTNIKLQDVAVIYKNKNSIILGKEGRGIYVYNLGVDMQKYHTYDVLVKELETYKGMREITSLQILKEHGKIKDIKPYFFDVQNLKKARGGDVVEKIRGKVKGKYLHTPYGAIKLYIKDKTKVKNGDIIELENVRISNYKNRVELVIEEKE